MNKRTTAIIVAVLILLMAGGIWAWMRRPDPEVVRINKMQDDMLAKMEPGKMPSREQFDSMRKETDKLSENQRRQVMEHGMRNMQRAMDKQIDDYIEATPEKKKQILDEHIKRMEDMRKEMEKHRGERPPGDRRGSAAGGGPGGGGPPPGGPGGGGPGGPGGRNRSPEARSAGFNQMLNHISPERRAKWSAFMSDMMKRRIELGLPPLGPPPGGGRPPK